MSKRILCILLCAVMIICAVPITSSAAYCSDCGEQIDSDEYCPDCYKCRSCSSNYCLFCGKCNDCTEICDRCEEICLDCHAELVGDGDTYPCPGCSKCKQDGTDYCLNCLRCADCVDMCEHCYEVCVECHDGLGGEGDCAPCSECHMCKQDGTDYCLFCDRCANCVTMCDRCNEVCLECHEELGGVDEYSACPDCGYCKAGMEYCTSCGKCSECADICPECQLCVECALDEGDLHCTECDECYAVNGQCPSGEEHCTDHCLICTDCGECFFGSESEYCTACEMCNSCAVSNGLHCEDCEVCSNDESDFCEQCGLCAQCCIDEGKHCPLCGNCYEEVSECESGLEHCTDCCIVCDDCGECQLESGEYCSLCEKCLNCCRATSLCTEGMCVSHPSYKTHFCTICNKCFDEVNQCTLCAKQNKNVCIGCCEHKERFNCITHTYDESGICTKCGYVRTEPTGKPVFVLQPQNVNAPAVTDIYDPDYESNYKITYHASLENDTGATYRWYYAYSADSKNWIEINDSASILIDGWDKPVIHLVLFTDTCYDTYYIKCVATNKYGSTESKPAHMKSQHNFIEYTSYDYFGHYHYWTMIEAEPDYHIVYCCGEGCTAALASSKEKHTYGAWRVTEQPTTDKNGKRVRYCSKCSCEQIDVMPKTHTCVPSDTLFTGTVMINSVKTEVHGHKCTICGEFTDYEQHNIRIFVDSFPTETQEGNRHYYCSKCSYTKPFTVPKLAHTHDYLKADYTTFTEKEYIKYGTFDENSHWSICLDKLDSGKCRYKHDVQPHTFGNWIVDSSDLMARKCTVCGYTQLTEKPKRPTSGEFFELYVKDATLYVNGQLTKGFAYIKAGDKIKIVADIKQAGKLFSKWTSANTPYDTDTGTKFGDIVKAGIITEAQSKKTTLEYTAKRGTLHIYPYTTDCPHNGAQTSLDGSAVTPTCTVNGKYDDVCCADCGLFLERAPKIPALGHNYVIDEATVVKATCKNKGYTGDVICTNCNTRYKNTSAGQIIEGAGVHTPLDLNVHTWDSGTVTKQQSYKSNGVVTYLCTLCKAKKTETTPRKQMTKPADVTKITASSTDSTITLTWDKADGATGYRVYSYDTAKKKYVFVKATENNEITLTGLDSAAQYKYAVKAYILYDSEVCESENYAKVPVLTLPTNVKGAKVSSVTASSYKLTWDKTSDADGYKIYKYDNKTYSLYKTVDTNSLTVKNIKSGVATDYYIKAYKVINGTVYQSKDYTMLCAATLPANVKGAKAYSVTTSSYKLTWDKTSGADGYKLYKYNNKKYTLYKTVSTNSLTVKNIKSGVATDYYIKAYEVINGTVYQSTDYTKLSVATLPANVKGAKVTSVTTSSYKLTWDKTSGADGYKIYKYSNKKYSLYKTVSTNSLTVKNIKSGVVTNYYIKAYVKAGSTQYQSTDYTKLSAATLPANVKSISYKATKNSVTLNWSKTSNADGYKVYTYNSKTKSYKAVKTVTKNTAVIKNLSAGKSYTYYVKAYKKVGSNMLYSAGYAKITTKTKK